MVDLTGQVAELHRLTRTDPDPRVRHRADALLLLAHGRSVDEAAHDMGCCTKRIRVWRRRFLAEGRQGLADRPRHGRPPKLDARAQAALGYRYRCPRHDLTHRQDAEAVASAKHVLRELQKRGRLPGLDFGLFTWMNAICTPTPTWRRSGSGAA